MEGYQEDKDQDQETVHKRVIVKNYGDGVAWSRGPMLGEGSFGSVHFATLKTPSLTHSCFPLAMAVKSADVLHSSTLQIEREVLSHLRGCPNIIQCFGEETTFDHDGTKVYNLLLEYGPGGTLADRIKRSGSMGLPEYEVRRFTRSILEGLAYIHEVGYVHCDLKPENILLGLESRRRPRRIEFTTKICDFGLAKRVQKSKKRKLESYCRGTPLYLSPEAVRDGVQEPPSDIWSLGCIVLEMLTGKPAWDVEDEGMDAENILLMIMKRTAAPKIPRDLSQDAKTFLKCCLKRMVRNRLSAKTLLHHPFVNGLNDDDDGVDEEEIEDMDDDCSSSSGEDSVSSWAEDSEIDENEAVSLHHLIA